MGRRGKRASVQGLKPAGNVRKKAGFPPYQVSLFSREF
jgi:hypothetical protein